MRLSSGSAVPSGAPVLRTSQLAVYDDVLASHDFAAVCEFVKTVNYEWVHTRRWAKAWRLMDGGPLQGPQALSHPVDWSDPVYPTRSNMDLVIETVLRHASEASDLLGEHPKDWPAFTARPYLYPQGTGLSWHEDARPFYRGAFMYYAHESWNAQWGGELLVIDERGGVEYPHGSQMSDAERA